ncbi:MAG: hypothetical protein N2C13_05485, partial [Chloroflexota bacterium]
SRLPLVLGLLVVGSVGIYAAYSFLGFGDTADRDNPSADSNAAQLTEAALALLPTDTPAPDATATPIPATNTPENTPVPTAGPTPKGGGPLIAFVSNRADGRTFQIFTINPEGNDLAQLTFSEGSKSQPRWSPDGKRLLFVASGARDNFGNDLGKDIWVMNADGSEPKFITRGYGVEFSPSWSPDGEWIAFAISIGSAPARLFLRTGEGADPRPFDLGKRVGQMDSPDWAPDGLTIVYSCIEPGQNEICLVVVEAAGTEIFTLTNTLGNKEPSFSPDGLWIVFTSTRDQNSEIYIMDSLGRNQVNISNHDAIDREASWQPQPNP